MLSTTKTISLNGTSTVEVNGVKTPVVYFNAQIQADGKYNINQSVQNVDLYKANKDAVKADRDEFEALVEQMTESGDSYEQIISTDYLGEFPERKYRA